jgi:predicted dehydrogenase
MGRYHAHSMLDIPEIQVVALCDKIKSRAQAFRKELFAPRGFAPQVYADHRTMLTRESPDMVVLVTPHAVHYEQIRDSLNAGAHVLSEKPMVTSSEHAREVVALAEEKDRLLGIAFQATMSAEFAYLANVIRRGDLGELQLVDTFVAQDWLQLTAGTWRHNPKMSGGGEMYDSGAHMLNAMLWLVDSPVKRVFALVDNCGTKVDINGTVSVQFANGCLASVACAGNASSPTESGMVIYGSRGTVKTGVWGAGLEHFNEKKEKVRYPFVPYESMIPDRNFVDTIRGNDRLRCPGRFGVLLAELMDAIYESVETGLPVEVRHRMKPDARKKR